MQAGIVTLATFLTYISIELKNSWAFNFAKKVNVICNHEFAINVIPQEINFTNFGQIRETLCP